MIAPREPLRRIVVVGGGQLGVLAAIALRRALPVCQVVVVGQLPSPASFADWSPTALPFTNKLHDRLGVAEDAIVLRAGGSHRLVTRYLGWGGEGQAGVLAYGETLDPVLKTAFAREWGGGRPLPGGPRPAGSVAEVLADAGRFAPPPPDQQTPLSDIDYSLRWNAQAYRGLLIEHAQALGVDYVEGEIDRVEPGEGDTIRAIGLAGQGEIEADFFVDCSGPQARLLASHPQFAMVDWSASLPTRKVYLSGPGAPMAALEDRVSLLAEGWLVEIAGRDGLYRMLGTSEEVSRDAALQALGAPAAAVVALEPGRVAAPWLGNVVALGDATARFEPIGPWHLDLAHRQLHLLLEMLPGRQIEPLERAEYNRRSVLMMEGVHETLALHFASDRGRAVFGDRALPNRLGEVIDQCRRRGRIPFREEQPLVPQEQFALMAALGFKPGLPPVARSAYQHSEERAKEGFAARSTQALQFAPPYERWLASMLQPSRAPAG
ncbi:tryptophan 7-halogenase [Qipengyuania sp. 6B39]|uniref:tryptophan 7-halogenase n=1 Tax=Qipengyuania proteolytica TaxID=2867239 RepID=UPI001C89230B|nr:tryptophan 7-halogenase [Qipengyuania proteolytica]MBX7495750.1 tryptophan 7-halogenase [Qipengyuania proteolytica]